MQNNNQRRRRRKNNNLSLLGAALLSVSIIVAVLVSQLVSPNSEIAQAFAPENGSAVQNNFSADGDKEIVVAIDAGHGGDDGGADELALEKDMTAQTVRYLEEYLKKDENYTPVLTHGYDTSASLEERREAARTAEAKLLLSVHGNTDPTKTATGFECFPAPPGRTYHEDSLRFAQLISVRMGEAGQRLRGERGVRYKYYELNSRGKYIEVIMEESDTEYNPSESFGIVDKASCPAVLAEQCFLTSSSDVEKWATDEGCKNAARIYYEAICEYFGTQAVSE